MVAFCHLNNSRKHDIWRIKSRRRAQTEITATVSAAAYITCGRLRIFKPLTLLLTRKQLFYPSRWQSGDTPL